MMNRKCYNQEEVRKVNDELKDVVKTLMFETEKFKENVRVLERMIK